HQGRQYKGNGAEWDVSLGVMGLYKPEYEGSDEYEVTGFPSVDIRYGEKYFLNARKGLGIHVLDRDGWKLSISAGYRFGRD
ncbi:MAG: MipA/OmpV family protein, partial [Deltaproteobacteria bacterium]|nr:MipA/OmpV family protein [Deltaproteobacteria bacterium]